MSGYYVAQESTYGEYLAFNADTPRQAFKHAYAHFGHWNFILIDGCTGKEIE